MLRTLKIKNFALIEEQTIDFAKGFNVLVGETGAGKSLILDALGFVMGDKSNKLNIRKGKDKLFVQAVFDSPSSEIISMLENNGIDVDDDVIFSRTLNLDGKSDSRINGCIVPVGLVKNIASLVLDTYTQNENIELLNSKKHLGILDAFSGSKLDAIKKEIEFDFDELNKKQTLMKEIGGDKTNRARELELIEYQIKDIEGANLKIGEDEEIKDRLNVLSNYEKIVESLKIANDNLNNVGDALQISQKSLNTAGLYNNSIIDLEERVSSVNIEIEDINETISDFLSKTEFDESELNALEHRLETISLLKKKYGFTIEEILTYLDEIKIKYDNLLFGEEKLIELEKEYAVLKQSLYNKCVKLSNLRKNVAIEIEKNVTQELKALGFKNATFKVDFKENKDITKNGIDDVEFLLSANAGQDLKSLSKTISGGEMSRFMLALKNIFAKCFNSSTLVFDEVDTGISGEIGQKVAEHLALLSKHYQLICITHLSQVTAMADNYIFVSKCVCNNETFTNISYLKGDDIIKYIATVSGAEPTNIAKQFALELKAKAEEFKAKV